MELKLNIVHHENLIEEYDDRPWVRRQEMRKDFHEPAGVSHEFIVGNDETPLHSESVPYGGRFDDDNVFRDGRF